MSGWGSASLWAVWAARCMSSCAMAAMAAIAAITGPGNSIKLSTGSARKTGGSGLA